MPESTGTCTGACCAVFWLPDDSKALNNPETRDEHYVKDMVIPLTRRQARDRNRKYASIPLMAPVKGWSTYTCKHWDSKTKLCGAYEDRPKMCSDYPYQYGRPCEKQCGYVLTQADNEAMAERDDSTWVWDLEKKGWRPRTNSKLTWYPDEGVYR